MWEYFSVSMSALAQPVFEQTYLVDLVGLCRLPAVHLIQSCGFMVVETNKTKQSSETKLGRTLPGLRTLDPPLIPPSKPAEIVSAHVWRGVG